ncbi:uncharacterized protein LOC101846505 [Aplysia californica]|uniref:Uncharacterized protein LOC101846505 n=1 Tax=Aplysia californica TaxID=6500 RepID=A0ABM0JR41_APLCA|nr:uncharacterized protein LOC101846505 [Aplysia californica]
MAYQTSSWPLWRKFIQNFKNGESNFHVSTKPLMVTFLHPGLRISSFDNYGKVDISDLLTLTVDVQNYAFYSELMPGGGTVFSWPTITQGRLLFVQSAEFSMTRAMQNQMLPKWPLQARLCLGRVGTSSVSVCVELLSPETGQLLLSHVKQLVTVDKVSRKPVPLPEPFRDKYRHEGVLQKPFSLERFAKPGNTFIYQLKVAWSDTDWYQHTNYASYARFATNALHQALVSGATQLPREKSSSESNTRTSFSSTGRSTGTSSDISGSPSPQSNELSSSVFQGISEDVVKNGLKTFRIVYFQECKEGETIDVHLWQQAGEMNVVRCHVNRGDQLLAQMTLEYFPTASDSKL